MQKAIFIFFIVVVQLFDDVLPSFPGDEMSDETNVAEHFFSLTYYHTSLTIIPFHTKFARKELVIITFRIDYIKSVFQTICYRISFVTGAPLKAG